MIESKMVKKRLGDNKYTSNTNIWKYKSYYLLKQNEYVTQILLDGQNLQDQQYWILLQENYSEEG